MGGRYRVLTETMWRNRERGFEMLQDANAVDQVPFLERPQKTVEAVLEAKAQLEAKGKGNRVLVVAPTHAEIDRYNEAIREHLKGNGKLLAGKDIDRLDAINWTEARRRDVRNYKEGLVLVFHKATNEAKKQESFSVLRTEGQKIICRSDQSGKETAFTKKQAASFGVFRREKMEVAIGDQLLLQTNRNERGHKLPDGTKQKSVTFENGEIVAVKWIDDAGKIHLQDGRVLPADYRQFKHGYAVTAHRAQGKSVDAVIVSADRMEGNLFYVAVSRGRELVKVLTSNTRGLRESVISNADRLSATELAKQAAQQKQREKQTGQHRRQRRWKNLAASARRRVKTWQQVFLKLYSRGHERDRTNIAGSFGGPSIERSIER
jgi:ATP-dependent exoDNAse (exonuclease V) alpha subunit